MTGILTPEMIEAGYGLPYDDTLDEFTEEEKAALHAKFPGLPWPEPAFAQLAETDLWSFSVMAWEHIPETDAFVPGWHIREKCLHLEQVTAGNIDRLLITEPPRSMKSTTVSVLWPSWEWCSLPGMSYLSMAYIKDLPIRDNQKSRALMSSNWYQKRWGRKWSFTSDQNVKTYYKNNKGGYRLAVSMSGAIGSGGRRIIVDDPLSESDAESPERLEGVVNTWTNSLALRNHPGGSTARVLIMQHLCEGDLADYVTRNEKHLGWIHLCFPAQYETDRPCRTPYGGDRRSREGEPLWIEAFGGTEKEARRQLEVLKASTPEYTWAAQAQQRPAPKRGGIFSRDWFEGDYLYDELPEGQPFVFVSWDTSVKGKDHNDPMVGYVIAHFPDLNEYYVLEEIRFWAEFPDQEDAVINTALVYPEAQAHVLEGKANGPAIVANIRRRMLTARKGSPDERRLKGLKGIDTWDPGTNDKVVRARSITPRMRAVQVRWPRWACGPGGWMEGQDGAIQEFCKFPKGLRDDRVDALTQGLIWNEMRDRVMGPGDRIQLGRPTLSHLLRLGGMSGFPLGPGVTGREWGL